MKKIPLVLFLLFFVLWSFNSVYAGQKDIILSRYQLEKIPNGEKYVSQLEKKFKSIKDSPETVKKLLEKVENIKANIEKKDSLSKKESYIKILVDFIIKNCEFYLSNNDSANVSNSTSTGVVLEKFSIHILSSETNFLQYLDTLEITTLEYISNEVYWKDFTQEIINSYTQEKKYPDTLTYFKKDLFKQAFLLKRKDLLNEKTSEYRKKMKEIKYEIENTYLKNGGKLENLIKEESGRSQAEDLLIITGLLDYEAVWLSEYDFSQYDSRWPYIWYYFYDDPKNGPQISFQILSYLNISDFTSIVLIEGNYEETEPFYYLSLFYDPNREKSILDGDIFASIK